MSLQDQIQHHLSRNEFTAARPLLDRAARTSTDPQLLLAYARVLLILNEKEPAAYQASRAITSALNTQSEPQLRIVAGELIQDCGRPKDAIRIFRDGSLRFPTLSTLRAGLINALRASGQSGEAGDEAERALIDFPHDLLLHLIGAGALGESLRQSAARAALLRALAMAPADPRALIPAATMLHYCDGIEPAQITEIHRRAGAALTKSVGPEWQPQNWDFSPDRRLKIALVSCDFRDHAVARFLEPWLTHRDRTSFEYIGVGLLGPEDATTQKLKSLFDHWIDATNKPDDQIVALIRNAKSDIAIDLSGLHVTARPAVFAKRVAPIQATYLGYAGTTGIPAMDYRIVDAITDPTSADALSTEKLIRLPAEVRNRNPKLSPGGAGLGVGEVFRENVFDATNLENPQGTSFLCFSPDPRAPLPTSTAKENSLTFCSFNAQQKITDATLDLWSAALKAVSHARLLLKSRTLADPRTREILNSSFAARSIDPSRIEIAPHAPEHASHLAVYNRADIALDTFPYNGTTTTCEALSMGLPVITLAGKPHASRVGASLLTAAGLKAHIADTAADFALIAASLAAEIAPRDAGSRAQAKLTLREKLLASSLCSGPVFARAMDESLRTLWRKSSAPA